jgi:hypothetical protein
MSEEKTTDKETADDKEINNFISFLTTIHDKYIEITEDTSQSLSNYKKNIKITGDNTSEEEKIISEYISKNTILDLYNSETFENFLKQNKNENENELINYSKKLLNKNDTILFKKVKSSINVYGANIEINDDIFVYNFLTERNLCNIVKKIYLPLLIELTCTWETLLKWHCDMIKGCLIFFNLIHCIESNDPTILLIKDALKQKINDDETLYEHIEKESDNMSCEKKSQNYVYNEGENTIITTNVSFSDDIYKQNKIQELQKKYFIIYNPKSLNNADYDYLKKYMYYIKLNYKDNKEPIESFIDNYDNESPIQDDILILIKKNNLGFDYLKYKNIIKKLIKENLIKEGGKKSNKRKTNKRKTRRRKTNKRKTNKGKTRK